MAWYIYVSYLFGGLFFANAIPHLVSGMMGRPFQSPFAKPPGEGALVFHGERPLGAFNIAVAYVLLCQVGTFDLHNVGHVAVAGLPAVAISLMLARHFGRFHGGNDSR